MLGAERHRSAGPRRSRWGRLWSVIAQNDVSQVNLPLLEISRRYVAYEGPAMSDGAENWKSAKTYQAFRWRRSCRTSAAWGRMIIRRWRWVHEEASLLRPLRQHNS
jgi:hypothetical protein